MEENSEIIASRNPMRILENTAAYSTKFRAYNFFAWLRYMSAIIVFSSFMFLELQRLFLSDIYMIYDIL